MPLYEIINNTHADIMVTGVIIPRLGGSARLELTEKQAEEADRLQANVKVTLIGLELVKKKNKKVMMK